MKLFWKIMMIGSVSMFIFLLILGRYLFPESIVKSILPFLIMLLAHISEMPISFKIAKSKGIPYRQIIIKTLLFGFTWWIPLKLDIFKK